MLLALSVLTASAEPRVSYGGPPGDRTLLIDSRPARYDAEADGLLSRLELSDGLRLAARDFVAVEMTKGHSARRAIETWVTLKRPEDVVIRCTRMTSTTLKCIYR